MRKTAAISAIALLLTSGTAWAGSWDCDDIFAPYTQRSDRMTSSSGNAQAINTATQVITFWPPRVHDRRIPANGARMAGALQRYRDGGKHRLPLMVKPDKDGPVPEMPMEPAAAGASSTAAPAGKSWQEMLPAGKPPAAQ